LRGLGLVVGDRSRVIAWLKRGKDRQKRGSRERERERERDGGDTVGSKDLKDA
jgi:hypothetical protein